MRRILAACLAVSLGMVSFVPQAMAKDAAKDAGAQASQSSATSFKPFPKPKSITQSTVVDGKKITYTATVGAIDVKDSKGKTIGQVVYTAYTVPGKNAASRPVTFAVNGGPGASSVYLNFGAIGPKHVAFGNEGDTASQSPVLKDNPGTWIDFTDLVFIDPIGTGFSRSWLNKAETKKAFYTANSDIHYLSRVIYTWLLRNKRMTSPKYLIGESYGGYRVPRLAYYLQTEVGVGISGITLVSPYLDPPALGHQNSLSPLPWMIDLPSMAAAHLEREGKPVNQTTMAPIEEYARTQFVTDFLAGPKDKAATDRLSAKVAELTGLDPKLVRRMDGRIDIATYLRDIRRKQGLVGSVYDSNVTAYDPFPAKAFPDYKDPLLASVVAPLTSAMVDFVTRQVGWKVNAPYHALSYTVNQEWERDNTDTPVTDLRKAIASDPKMAVNIVHGWNDLSCPFFGSMLIIDQMPSYGVKDRVHLFVFPGGHMFYTRPGNHEPLRRDIMPSYQR